MASLGTSDPSAPDTFWYRMRAPDRLSIWLNDTDLRDTALKSFTGMLTSPKLIDPLQMALGMAESVLPDLFAVLRTCVDWVLREAHEASSDDTTVRGPTGELVPGG